MQDSDPIHPFSAGEEPEGTRCEPWEALLPALLDGSLSPAEASAVEQHSRQCPNCAGLLEAARQGKEWLGFLDRQPPVPNDLVDRILALTSGASSSGQSSRLPGTLGPVKEPAADRSGLARVWTGRTAAQTPPARIFSTIAMAFFSIMLTVSLVHSNFTGTESAKPATTIASAVADRLGSANELAGRYRDSLAAARESLMNEVQREIESLKRVAKPLGFGTPSATPQPGSTRKGSPEGEAGADFASERGQVALNSQNASRRRL